MTIVNSSFQIGDSVKITNSSWEHSWDILCKFGFKKDAVYEVSGVYANGVISLKGATATYYPSYFELAKDDEPLFADYLVEMFSCKDLKESNEQLMEHLDKPDAVNHPKHYAVFEQLEAIEVIACSMTTQQFYGYCLGNILKYRLRAGGKDDVMQELGKADKYQELFTKHKHLCKDAV